MYLTKYQNVNYGFMPQKIICLVKLSWAKVTQLITFRVNKFCLDVSLKFDYSSLQYTDKCAFIV